MPISRRALADDEDVLVDLHPHWVFVLGPAALAAVAVAVAVGIAVRFPKAPVIVAPVLAVMVAVPLLWLVGRTVRWWSISLIVTTSRLLYRQGVFGRDLVQVRLQRVTEVHCTQTLPERLIGSGRLVLELQGEDPVVVDDVRRPRVLQRVVAGQLDELAAGPPERSPAPLAGYPEAALPPGPPTYARADVTPPQGVPAVGAGADPAAPSAIPAIPVLPADGIAPPAGAGTSPVERLVVLDGLRRQGIISNAEFEQKKAELLDHL